MQPATDLFKTYQQAEAMLASGELKGAASLCQQMLEQDPNYAYGHYLMASLFRATGDMARAKMFIDMALQITPENSTFHLVNGQILVALEQWKEAAGAFAAMHKLEPDNAVPLMLWAACCGNAKQFDKAVDLFRRARALANIPDIDEHEGLCMVTMGNMTRANELFDRLIERRPDYFYGYVHKAKLLIDKKQLSEAEMLLGNALKLNNIAYEALYHMALLQDLLGRPEFAIQYAFQALHSNPRGWETHILLGHILVKQKKFDIAEQTLMQAFALKPDNVLVLQLLVSCLMYQRKHAQALQHINTLLAIHPDDATMQFFKARLTGEQPAQAPQDYVVGLFDNYAEQFEHHLVTGLSYQTPKILAELLKGLDGIAGKNDISMLDLGCGTGLMGQAVRDITFFRVGVDLSSGMLDKARRKECYQELHVADVVDYMTSNTRSFDLVTAVDVLIYSGDLAPFMKAARNVMKPDGLLALSIEKETESTSYRLNTSGRYSHAPEYVLSLALESGYVLVKQEDTILRMEHYTPVQGVLFLFRKVQTH